MIVYWGLIAGSNPARYRVRVNAPNAGAAQERGSEQGAKALAKQLAGGRADRVKRTTFPATTAAAALAAPSKDAKAEAKAEAKAKAKAEAAEAEAAKAAAAAKADAGIAADVVSGSAKNAIADIEGGDLDDILDLVEAAEQLREGGERVTVIRAIERRRAAE